MSSREIKVSTFCYILFTAFFVMCGVKFALIQWDRHTASLERSKAYGKYGCEVTFLAASSSQEKREEWHNTCLESKYDKGDFMSSLPKELREHSMVWKTASGKLLLMQNDQKALQRKMSLYDPVTKGLETFYQEPISHEYPEVGMVMASPDGSKFAFERLSPFPGYSAGIWIIDIAKKQCLEATYSKVPNYWHSLLGWTSNTKLKFMEVRTSPRVLFQLNCSHMTTNP